jgi:hypothetical protein
VKVKVSVALELPDAGRGRGDHRRSRRLQLLLRGDPMRRSGAARSRSDQRVVADDCGTRGKERAQRLSCGSGMPAGARHRGVLPARRIWGLPDELNLAAHDKTDWTVARAQHRQQFYDPANIFPRPLPETILASRLKVGDLPRGIAYTP